MRKIEYDAPLDSVPYLALLRVCRSKGIDPDKVNELMWAINAEASLTGLLRIIGNLRDVIGEAVAQKVVSQQQLDSLVPWRPEVTQLLDHADLLVDECGEQLVAAQKGHNRDTHPLTRFCLERNALYALLWNRADERSLRKRLLSEGVEHQKVDAAVERFVTKFRLLQWHLFYTHHSLMNLYVSIKDYLSHSVESPVLGKHNNSLYDSCRSARDYSDGAKWEKFDKLDVHTSSHNFFMRQSDAFAEELDVTARPFKTFGTKWFLHTDQLRNGSHGSRRVRRRRKSTAYRVEYGGNMSLYLANPGEDIDGRPQQARVLTQWDDSKEWKEADLPEEEMGQDDEEQVLVSLACSAHGSQRDQVMVAIGFAHKRAVLNQHLPIRYELMTLGEVASAMRTLGDAVKETSHKLPYRKAAAMGILMYWTGSDLERIRNLIVVPPGAHVADDVDIAYFLADNTWRIRVPIYKAKRKVPDGVASLCRPWGEHLRLPDLWSAHTFIRMIAEKRETEDEGKIYKPFDGHNQKTYGKALNTIFEYQRSRQGKRITPARLGNDLFLRLLSWSDPVNALLITGKWHSSVSTARHYSTPSVKHLATLYREMAVGLVEKIRQEQYGDRPELASLPELPEEVLSRPNLGVGAAYCPSVAEVKGLLQRTTEALQRESRPLEYNNLYSIYTALVIGYCTGYRAVRDICLDESRRDPISQWAWISDKNDEKGSHTRRVYLAPVLEEQLKAYEAHRRVVLASWESHYPRVIRPEYDELPYLFLVNEKRRNVVPTSSATMVTPLKELEYPLPLNANRKFLRTELSERGCPIDVLSAYMGHWSLGQEPHGNYSCLSPRHERRQLEKYLVPLLEEIGVQCIHSRWVSY